MPNTQNLATVGVTNRQDTDNIIVEQGGNIRRVQYEDIKTGILRGDAADGTISTFEESAEEFPIPAPATPQKTLWGRVKKFCSDFNDWKTGVMLFGHLVNNAESDSDTLPLAASVAKLLQEQITTNTGAIAQLNSDIYNLSLKYDNLSYADGVSYSAGGYVNLGRLVIVNLRLILSKEIPSEDNIVAGLPTYTGYNYVSLSNNKNADLSINAQGSLKNINSTSAGTLIVNAVYVCQ